MRRRRLLLEPELEHELEPLLSNGPAAQFKFKFKFMFKFMFMFMFK
jgi:hypothetical protein